MAPRRIHKLSSTSYNFIEQFLTEQWYIVREDHGNVDSKDKVSIDIIWESFQNFMNDHGYSSTLCNKILLGKLLHQSGVEKIKRGPRKQQRFYYFPIRPVQGSKSEEIYRKRKAMEDFDASFISPPRDVKPSRADLCSTEQATSAKACEVKPPHKSMCISVPVCSVHSTPETKNTRRRSIEGRDENMSFPQSTAITVSVCCLQDSRLNNKGKSCHSSKAINTVGNFSTQVTASTAYGTYINNVGKGFAGNSYINHMAKAFADNRDINNVGKGFAGNMDRGFDSDMDIKHVGRGFAGNTDINNMGRGFVSDIDINNVGRGFSGNMDINVCNGSRQYCSSTSNERLNFREPDFSGKGRWPSTVANIKKEGCTSVDGQGSNYLDAHNSLSSVTLSYSDCFDPLFRPSLSARTDHQNTGAGAARAEIGEHSGWNDVPYVPNFVNHSMTSPFTCWGAEAKKDFEPLDLSTSN